MRRTATKAASVLPKELILQIQEHMPEGGKLSIPKKGCHPRFLMTDEEKLEQNLEITMESLRLVPTKQLASTYTLSVPAIRTIIRQTLDIIHAAQGEPPPAFLPNKPLDKDESDQ